MASINKLKQNKNKNNSSTYLKCLSLGMKEWLTLKSITGNKRIRKSLPKLRKKIDNIKEKNPNILSKSIVVELNSIGLEKETLKEFKGIFNQEIII